jgi:hypothetical protein
MSSRALAVVMAVVMAVVVVVFVVLLGISRFSSLICWRSSPGTVREMSTVPTEMLPL